MSSANAMLEDPSDTTVRAAIARRSAALGLDEEGYRRLVEQDPCERLLLRGDTAPSDGTWLAPEAHVSHLEHRLLPVVESRQRNTPRPVFRAWCAHAGDGADAWGLALSFLRGVADADCWEASVLATDASFRALAQAQVGIYRHAQVAMLDPVDRDLAFGHAAVQPAYLVGARLRALVQFAHLDLESEQWPVSGPFDAIVCRGLLGGLAPDASERLVRRLAGCLRRGGALYADGFTGDAKALRLVEQAKGVYVR